MIQASNLELRDGGAIASRSTSTRTTGPEAGGNIDLIADRVTFSGDSLISAESTRSRKAGNISILARDTFQSDNSSVTTATLRDGAGGDITITSSQVQLSHGAVISAKSAGKGDPVAEPPRAEYAAGGGCGDDWGAPLAAVHE
jgi:hypothetical protein